jgi:hypothetical protein
MTGCLAIRAPTSPASRACPTCAFPNAELGNTRVPAGERSPPGVVPVAGEGVSPLRASLFPSPQPSPRRGEGTRPCPCSPHRIVQPARQLSLDSLGIYAVYGCRPLRRGALSRGVNRAEGDAAPAGGFREPALGKPDQRRPPGTTARAPVQRGLGSAVHQDGRADERQVRSKIAAVRRREALKKIIDRAFRRLTPLDEFFEPPLDQTPGRGGRRVPA